MDDFRGSRFIEIDPKFIYCRLNFSIDINIKKMFNNIQFRIFGDFTLDKTTC
jgi:hypothetical protein